MILSKVIEQVRALKSGYEVSEEQLRRMINAAEMMILTNIVRDREGDAAVLEEYTGVDMDSEDGAELFAPAPYEDIYAQYCAAQIDLLYEDGERYLNDAAVFHDTYNALMRFWWQTHRQIKRHAYFK